MKKLSALLLSMVCGCLPALQSWAKDDKTEDPLASLQANPFQGGACANVALLEEKDYAKQKGYWDDVASTCGSQVQVQVLPDGDFLNSMISRLSDKDDTAASAFLKSVGQRAMDNIDYNNRISEVFLHCARGEAGAGWFREKREEAERAGGRQAKGALELYDFGQCPNRLAELRKVIQEKGPDFRVSLAMMRKTAGIPNKLAAALRTASGTTLDGEKVELSAKEEARVKQLDSELTARAMKEIQRLTEKDEVARSPKAKALRDFLRAHVGALPEKPAVDAAVNAYKRQEFEKYFKAYSDAQNAARVLVFLKSRDPSDAELADALKKLVANGESTRESVEKRLAAGGKPGLKDGDRATEMLELLQYGGAVSDVLKGDPSQCRLGAGLARFVQKTETRKQAAISLGLLAGGLATGAAAPVLAAAGVAIAPAMTVALGAANAGISAGGIGYGFGTLAQDYLRYQGARDANFSFAHSDADKFGTGREVGSLERFQEARNAFAINLAMQTLTNLPTLYRGGKWAVNKMLADNASKFGAPEVMEQLTARKMKELIDSGVQPRLALKQADVEVKRLFQQFGSKDASVARAAGERLAALMGVDPSEIKAFQKLVSKQLLDPDAAAQYKMFSQRFHESLQPFRNDIQSQVAQGKLTQEAAKAAVGQKAKELGQRIDAILERFPDSINPAKRTDAVRLALSASDFGVKDVDQINRLAANVKNWDDAASLYGLSRTFDRASANMRLPELQAISDLAKRREAAFGKALEDLGVTNAAVRRQMIGCASVGMAR